MAKFLTLLKGDLGLNFHSRDFPEPVGYLGIGIVMALLAFYFSNKKKK